MTCLYVRQIFWNNQLTVMTKFWNCISGRSQSRDPSSTKSNTCSPIGELWMIGNCIGIGLIDQGLMCEPPMSKPNRRLDGVLPMTKWSSDNGNISFNNILKHNTNCKITVTSMRNVSVPLCILYNITYQTDSSATTWTLGIGKPLKWLATGRV